MPCSGLLLGAEVASCEHPHHRGCAYRVLPDQRQDALAMNLDVSPGEIAGASRANRQREHRACADETVTMWQELVALDDGAPLLSESASNAEVIERLRSRFGSSCSEDSRGEGAL